MLFLTLGLNKDKNNILQNSKTDTKEINSLQRPPNEVLECIFKLVVFDKSKAEEQMKQYRNIRLVCTRFNDILNHPDFLSRSTKRRWSLISSRYMSQNKLIENLQSIASLGQQCMKEDIKELVSNYSNSHVQSASTILFSASRGQFFSLTNKKKTSSVLLWLIFITLLSKFLEMMRLA